MNKSSITKATAVILAGVMMRSMALTGCGRKEEPEPAEPDTSEVTREYEVETSTPNRNFEGEFPDTLTIDGKTYNISSYSDIEFEQQDTEEMVERWTDVNVEDKSEIPEKADFEYNGDLLTFDLSETYLTQGRITKTLTATVDYPDYTSTPSDVPETTMITVEMPDGTTREVEGRLQGVERISEFEWRDGMAITGVWLGDPAAEEYVLDGTDITVPYKAEAPTWGGFQSDIINAMGLPASSYKITGGEWADKGQKDRNGNFVRHATYYGSHHVADFQATYAYSYETEGYSGQAAYRTNADKVKAPEKDRVTVYRLKAIVKYYLVETAGGGRNSKAQTGSSDSSASSKTAGSKTNGTSSSSSRANSSGTSNTSSNSESKSESFSDSPDEEK